MTTRPLALLTAFALGGAVGALAVFVALRPSPSPTPAPVAPVVVSEDSAVQVRGDGTAWVTFANGVDQRRVLGVVIAEHDVIVIRAADFIPADDAWWHSATGVRRLLKDAVAWDLDVGLIAFAVGDSRIDGITLSAQDGALYLGRDVVAVGDQTRLPAFVDSAAIGVGPNDYRYEIQTQGTLDAGSGAIVLPPTGELIGLAVQRETGPDGDRLRAIDAAALRSLLARRASTQPLRLADYTRFMLDTPQGILAELQRSAERGRWRNAVVLASELNDRFAERMTPAVRDIARVSAAQLARGYGAAGQPAAELTTLTDAVDRFGPSPELLRLTADAYLRSDRAEEAIAMLQRAAQRVEPGAEAHRRAARDLLRRVIVERMADPRLAPAAVIGLLRDALARDADFAPYHRHLGGLYYDAGRYAEAEYHLQRALDLDPLYAADVDMALRQSRQRRQATSLIEVPLEAAGGALYVNARVNGSGQSFRFLLDTGASYTAINHHTLLRLGLSEIFARGAPPIELETAAGRIFAQSFTLDSINVAGAIVHQVPVVILEDMGPLDGLLGLSFLRHFNVDINQREGKLLLTPR